ncbi:MAG: cyclase family protein [Geobacteraceae bacterium]|nr:cyclase family protein [Geobacteraceae bacterium]
MKIHDISIRLANDTPCYPGDPRVTVESVLSMETGDGANVSRITLASHSGTHLDAPFHMIAGALPMSAIPLSPLMGKALVADLTGRSEIGARELLALPLRGVTRLLLKTDNSRLWETSRFYRDYVSLVGTGVDCLMEAGIELVGIDYLSIEACDGNGNVHRRLLEKGILILEGLDLSAVAAGVYELICLPLKVAAEDGAPVRAILRELEEGK